MGNKKNKKTAIIIGGIIAVLIIIFDKVMKALFIEEDIILIPNILSFTYVENEGAVFGILENSYYMLLSIRVIILILTIRIIQKTKNNNIIIAISFIISGVIGNLIDMILRKHVIDFINFTIIDFVVFNFADVSVVIGVLLTIIFIVFGIIKKEIKKLRK